MSKPEAPEPPPAVVLSVKCVVDGRYYHAGSALPFANESDLPESLKPFVATGEEPSVQPVQRNIYDLPLSTRRQVRRLEMHAAHQEFAEQEAAAPLPEDLQTALEDAHTAHVGRLLKQAEVSAQRADDTYKHLEEEAAAKVTQYFVRRGGEWARVQNARLKPGETTFVRRENGQMEPAGIVNAAGEPPEQQIQL